MPLVPSRVGDYPSIAVDASGNPHIVYRRDLDTNNEFRYAHWTGSAWTKQTINDLGANYSSLVLNAGLPVVAYQEATTLSLHLAQYDGATWSNVLIDNLFPQEGYYTSLAFDPAGMPHIAYQELSSALNLKHAWYPGGWTYEDADGFNTNYEEGRYSSLAITPADTIGIAYAGFDPANPFMGPLQLRFAENTSGGAGGGWTIDVPDPVANPGQASLAFTPIGQPAIAFVSNNGSGYAQLRYALRDPSGAWTVTVVDSATSATLTLRFDSLGQGHILYNKNLGLWHAYQDGHTWLLEPVDLTPGSGSASSSLAIGPNDALHAAYKVGGSASHGSLRYARKILSAWVVTPIEGEGQDEGEFLSLGSNSSGNPSIAFYDATNGALDFTYLNPSVGDWSADEIAEGGDVGRFVRESQRPLSPTSSAGVYYDATNGLLRLFAGSFDAWGSATSLPVGHGVAGVAYAESASYARIAVYDSVAGELSYWRVGPGAATRVVVDNVGNPGRSCSIAFDSNQLAHIVYYAQVPGDLRRARPMGSGWLVDTIDVVGDVGRACDVRTNGTAIDVAYYDATNQSLKFARNAGAIWTAPQTVAAGHDVGRALALGLNGIDSPRIAYYDATTGDLMYARLLGNGTWDNTAVDTALDVGRSISMRTDVSTGLSQIAYYDATRGRIKFAREFPDPAGVGEPMPSAGITEQMHVSPNPIPAGRSFSLSLAGGVPSTSEIEAFDVLGRKIAAIRGVLLGGGSPPVSWRLPGSPAGVVFFEAKLHDGREVRARAAVLR